MYANLKAEIARHGKKKSELADKLGITENTLINKIKGKSEFTLTEIQTLLKEFPTATMDYLFEIK
jgi:DNA-binding Xre family transcriptional regulator